MGGRRVGPRCGGNRSGCSLVAGATADAADRRAARQAAFAGRYQVRTAARARKMRRV
ncbi:hypothetical protein KCH_12230 [Kitasatospora cheerisanensis KCTC 2395]|uniref:Uncharacterized protein n=1 Tax=Kitasatospora cheerisanensis KCTC 2395 TaxID=1348663 RepID=A0A066Z030_9ACTN|nr:hypothetical protein KCH_12230 [Kitasatospora cheerisanensis KCTC 2395]